MTDVDERLRRWGWLEHVPRFAVIAEA